MGYFSNQRPLYYFKMIKHPLKYEKCGLVLNTDYNFMGASPDGKVIIDTTLEGQKKFGILEVKCPEQYKEIDPKHAALVSDNFCLHLSLDGELRINKNHAYYDQVQHQLAMMTGCHFCDFVECTFKGAVIDGVYFDLEHWKRLCEKICTFLARGPPKIFRYTGKILPVASLLQSAFSVSISGQH